VYSMRGIPTEVDFVYDGKMRRRIEQDHSWNGSSWTQMNEVHFVYDSNVVTGANPDRRNADGKTAVDEARNRPEVLQLLSR